MQSNSATSKRRGGRGRVSLYLFLGAGLGAATVMLFSPRKKPAAQNVLALRSRSESNDSIAALRPVNNESKDRPVSENKAPNYALAGKDTAQAARKRNPRTTWTPDMRISEQRYRIAHSGRRPSNIL